MHRPTTAGARPFARAIASMARAVPTLLAALAVLAALVGPAQAQAASLGATLDAGTTGLGAAISVALVPDRLNLRIGLHGADLHHDGHTSDVDYRFHVQWRTLEALLDWFPMGGAFRVSGGIVYNDSDLSGRSLPDANGNYVINGTTYPSGLAGRIDARVDYRRWAPYLGVGWGNAAASRPGWGWSVDLGAMYLGTATVRLENSGCQAGVQSCAQLSSDLASEAARVGDKVNQYRWLPVARVGLTYRF